MMILVFGFKCLSNKKSKSIIVEAILYIEIESEYREEGDYNNKTY